jgi:hypothetical protein
MHIIGQANWSLPAALGEPLRDRPPDAAGGAGQQRAGRQLTAAALPHRPGPAHPEARPIRVRARRAMAARWASDGPS